MDDSAARVARIEARGGYDRAEICLNGHVTHPMIDNYRGREKPFCPRCGAKTIQACQSCGNEIRGAKLGRREDRDREANSIASYVVPAFCERCGNAYPWTGAKILAAKALADELSELSDADRILLKASIDDIAADTPMTTVAVTRVKKLIPKVAQESAGALRRLIVDVAGKTAAEL